MVALRSLTPDVVVDPRELMLAEQRDRVRRRLCVSCGVERHLCGCGDYEDGAERGGSNDDDGAPA